MWLIKEEEGGEEEEEEETEEEEEEKCEFLFARERERERLID